MVFTQSFRKPRQAKFGAEIEDLIQEVIDDHFLKKNGPNAHACFHILEEKAKIRGLLGSCIKKSAFYKRIEGLDVLEVTLARKGREAARKKSQYTEEVIISDFPLQYVEIDALHLNVGILCEETNEFLGSLIVYLAIDRFSRCILGYSLSIKGRHGERSDAVIACLKHAVMPKPEMQHTENSWDCFGVPHYILCDAGPAFNNQDVIAFISQLGSSRIVTQTKTPKKKPFVERLNRTIRLQFARLIPGYVGKRLDGEEIDTTVSKSACIYLSEVKNALDEFIVDYYHDSGHKGLDMRTPSSVWSEFAEDQSIIRMPPEIETLEKFIGISFDATIQASNGIQKNNLMYQSRELRDLYFKLTSSNKAKEKNPVVRCSYNRRDISSIAVTDPNTMQVFLVPCTNKRIKPGTSLEEYKAQRNVKNQSPKKYMTASESVFEPAKERQKSRNRKTKKPSKSSLQLMKKQSVEDLETILHGGQGRFAEVVKESNKEEKPPFLTDDDSIDFDQLPDIDVE